MPTIAGGHDPNVSGRPIEASFERRLELPIARLAWTKREVVGKDQEAVAALVTPNRLQHVRQLDQFLSVDLHDPQPLLPEDRQEPLHRRRFAGAPLSEQEDVIGRQALDVLTGVAHEVTEVSIDPNEIVEVAKRGHVDRNQPTPALPVERPLPPEGKIALEEIAAIAGGAAMQQALLREFEYAFETVENSCEAPHRSDCRLWP